MFFKLYLGYSLNFMETINSEANDFIQFIKQVQDKAAERGLTEEILNDILNTPFKENEH
jgi:hypothetical protein